MQKPLTMHRMHLHNAVTERLYWPKNGGGRGLLQLEFKMLKLV